MALKTGGTGNLQALPGAQNLPNLRVENFNTFDGKKALDDYVHGMQFVDAMKARRKGGPGAGAAAEEGGKGSKGGKGVSLKAGGGGGSAKAEKPTQTGSTWKKITADDGTVIGYQEIKEMSDGSKISGPIQKTLLGPGAATKAATKPLAAKPETKPFNQWDEAVDPNTGKAFGRVNPKTGAVTRYQTGSAAAPKAAKETAEGPIETEQYSTPENVLKYGTPVSAPALPSDPKARLEERKIANKEIADFKKVLAIKKQVYDAMQNFRRAQEGEDTGPVQGAIQSIGGGVGKFFSSDKTNEMRALSADMATASRIPGSGPQTDRDVVINFDKVPSIRNEPEVNKEIIDNFNRSYDYYNDYINYLESYVSQYGTTKGAKEAYEKYSTDNPVYIKQKDSAGNEISVLNPDRKSRQAYFGSQFSGIETPTKSEKPAEPTEPEDRPNLPLSNVKLDAQGNPPPLAGRSLDEQEEEQVPAAEERQATPQASTQPEQPEQKQPSENKLPYNVEEALTWAEANPDDDRAKFIQNRFGRR